MVTKLPSTALAGKVPTVAGINVGEDDLTVYDEGTWTPVVKIGTVDITNTGSTYGKFTRVGNVMHITAKLYFNIDSNIGTLSVEGLPVAGDSGTDSALNIRADNSIDCTPPLGASVNAGDSVISLYVQPDSTAGTLGGMSQSQVASSTDVNMIITGHYFV